MTKLKLGKLPHEFLSKLLHQLPPHGDDLIVPPGVGRDAAGLKIGDKLVAVTADPITFTVDHLAMYSIAVNVNDVACLGCRPKWYTGVLLLPPETLEKHVEIIWSELIEQLARYNIQPIGGHVEVTETVNQPVLIGQMMGEMIGDELLDPAQAKPGDKILLWQKIAIEGTALIAKEKASKLSEKFSPSEISHMQNLLFDPGICVWPFVEKLLPYVGVVALHDPTEGGVATAIHEVSEAAQCGVEIQYDALPFLPETLKLADHLNFNPLGLLASGCLLITCRPEAAEKLINGFPDEPIVCIGELIESPDCILVRGGQAEKLARFDQDEIAKVVRSGRELAV